MRVFDLLQRASKARAAAMARKPEAFSAADRAWLASPRTQAAIVGDESAFKGTLTAVEVVAVKGGGATPESLGLVATPVGNADRSKNGDAKANVSQ